MGLHSNYTDEFGSDSDLMYPAENLIRIFKGTYPELDFSKDDYSDRSILDVGCGDGRHLVFLASDLDLDSFGVEPTDELADIAESNIREAGVDADVRQGTSRNLPYEDDRFDFLLANSSYYMGEQHEFDFESHVEEYARVLKDSGRIILSIPKPSSFIFEDSDIAEPGYRIVRNDPFGIRNGTILRQFEDAEEIEEAFMPSFGNFTIASIHDDFFGYNYHWWLLVGDYEGGA